VETRSPEDLMRELIVCITPDIDIKSVGIYYLQFLNLAVEDHLFVYNDMVVQLFYEIVLV